MKIIHFVYAMSFLWHYLFWSFDKGLSVLKYDISLNFNKQNCGRSQWRFLISKGTFDYPSDFGVPVVSIYFLYETICRLLFIFSQFFFYDPCFPSTCVFYFFKVYSSQICTERMNQVTPYSFDVIEMELVISTKCHKILRYLSLRSQHNSFANRWPSFLVYFQNFLMKITYISTYWREKAF